MSSMASVGLEPDQRSSSPRSCQRAVLQNLRRLVRGPATGIDESSNVLPPSAEMVRAEGAFRGFLKAAQQVQGVRVPNLGEPGSLSPTKDEHRLLRALAAAQAGDQAVLDNYLYKFALDRRQRVGLADAVRALAAALAAVGLMLPALPTASVPASALRIASMRGLALDEIEVAWPGAPKG